MAAPELVRSATTGLVTGLAGEVVPDNGIAPAAGHGLVSILFHRGGSGTPAAPAGWTQRAQFVGTYGSIDVAYREADATDDGACAWDVTTSATEFCGVILEYDQALTLDDDAEGSDTAGPSLTIGTVTPTADIPAVILLAWMSQPSQAPALPPWTLREVAYSGSGNRSRYEVRDQLVDPTAGSYGGETATGITDGSTDLDYVIVAFAGDGGSPPPEPEPPVDPGDYVPPPPAKAIVEIFVDDPAGAKWDVARWDEAVWPAAFWDPIDDLSLSVTVVNGTDRGDQGIVAEPSAGTFVVETFDPDRILDPANASSPYAGQLEPGLPIRLNHRSTTLRTQRVSAITYSHELQGGRISAIDALGQAAQPKVPSDVDLADTLWQRVAEAIAAADADLELMPAPATDPPLAPYATGDELSVLEHIKRAALEALHVPYVDRDGRIGFRSWIAGLERARVIGSPELLDLGSWISDDGLLSVVRVLDEDGVTPHVREATPTPRYGKRVFDRREDLPTIDAEAWAETVLADRRAQTLRHRPGEIRPLDAASVESVGTMEILEGIDLRYPETDPPIDIHVRILGTRIFVSDETKDPTTPRSRWRFTLTVSSMPPVPLTNDDDPSDFLTSEDESDYLYAG